MKKALMTTLLVSTLIGALAASSPAVSEHETHHPGGEQPLATSPAMVGMMEMMAGGMHDMMGMMQRHQGMMADGMRHMMEGDSGMMGSRMGDMMTQGMKHLVPENGAGEKPNTLDSLFE